ncbi:MAG: lysophospholipid acyltransferase family protein [Candidatus Omnitrophica bacterium]|nr:lysophospholipid acyltransferase family protein [Candidatus Omnitrophota bacterium]
MTDLMKKKKRFKLRNFIPGWDFIEYACLRILVGILNSLPMPVCVWISQGIGDLLYFAMAKRRKIALYNLNIAYGNSLPEEEKKRIARQSFRHMVTALVEFFRIPVILKEAHNRFIFEGTEHLDLAFSKGKGIVFVISHLGAWEYLAFLPYLRGYPCSVVVRPIRNPYIYEWIQGLRKQTQLNPIDKSKAVRKVLTELKNNHLAAVLIDQWAGPEGVWVDFFEKPTSTTSIPVRFAKKTGCVLIPAYCLRIGSGRYKIHVDPEIEIHDQTGEWEIKTTLALNQWLEKTILAYPEQWSWVHRRWKMQSGDQYRTGDRSDAQINA